MAEMKGNSKAILYITYITTPFFKINIDIDNYGYVLLHVKEW